MQLITNVKISPSSSVLAHQCPPPFWPIHLMAALSVWQYCGTALLIEQISRLRSTSKKRAGM